MDWVRQLTDHFMSLEMLKNALISAKVSDNVVSVQLGKQSVDFSKKTFDRLRLSFDTADADSLCLIKFRFWVKDDKERRLLEFVYPDDHKMVTFDLTDY